MRCERAPVRRIDVCDAHWKRKVVKRDFRSRKRRKRKFIRSLGLRCIAVADAAVDDFTRFAIFGVRVLVIGSRAHSTQHRSMARKMRKYRNHPTNYYNSLLVPMVEFAIYNMNLFLLEQRVSTETRRGQNERRRKKRERNDYLESAARAMMMLCKWYQTNK